VQKKVTLQADTLFDFDKSAIKPEGQAVLNKLATQIKGIQLEVIIAVGNTDSIGTDAYNQLLGQRRAQAVKTALVSRGIPAAKIYTESKGKRDPVASNATAEGRAQNRRVDIEVVGK
jgi:OOP family OmpA-OmpF porin